MPHMHTQTYTHTYIQYKHIHTHTHDHLQTLISTHTTNTKRHTTQKSTEVNKTHLPSMSHVQINGDSFTRPRRSEIQRLLAVHGAALKTKRLAKHQAPLGGVDSSSFKVLSKLNGRHLQHLLASETIESRIALTIDTGRGTCDVGRTSPMA